MDACERFPPQAGLVHVFEPLLRAFGSSLAEAEYASIQPKQELREDAAWSVVSLLTVVFVRCGVVRPTVFRESSNDAGLFLQNGADE